MLGEENGSWTQYQKLVLKLLEQHDEKLEALRKQLATSVNDRVVITENINSMKEDITFLLGLIRDGSIGVTPILTKIDHIETELKTLKEQEANRAKEINDIKSYKRALFLSILGILASVGWDILQRLVLAGK